MGRTPEEYLLRLLGSREAFSFGFVSIMSSVNTRACLISAAGPPPDLLELPGKRLLPPDDDRDVVLVLDHPDAGSSDSPLDVVAAV